MIWFTSDTHFGHALTLKFRDYASVEDMDADIIRIWNEHIGKKDAVYHLGDVTFRAMDLSVLNGRKVLIKGNHDYRRLKQLEPYFVDICDLKEVRYNKRRYVLCHYPMLTWPSRHYGSWHLHGHSHGAYDPTPGVQRLDVGIDAIGRPVSVEEIEALDPQAPFLR